MKDLKESSIDRVWLKMLYSNAIKIQLKIYITIYISN